MELTIARDVIGEWNARNALGQKRILLPLVGERDAAPVDLLIAFVCGKAGTPGGSETEIEKQLQSGKPALVYFSEGRDDLSGGQVLPVRALEEFKKRVAAAVVDSYGDEKELRAKFARQLDATISAHAHFKAEEPDLSEVLPALPDVEPVPAAAPLSACAQTILSEACDDFEAYIGRIKAGGMLRIQANGKQLVEQNDPATIAKWDNAFNELLAGQYIRDAGCNGQLFQISEKGFDFLKTIGRTPVGYIAEMGGM
jgi:hypothetical protein